MLYESRQSLQSLVTGYTGTYAKENVIGDFYKELFAPERFEDSWLEVGLIEDLMPTTKFDSIPTVKILKEPRFRKREASYGLNGSDGFFVPEENAIYLLDKKDYLELLSNKLHELAHPLFYQESAAVRQLKSLRPVPLRYDILAILAGSYLKYLKGHLNRDDRKTMEKIEGSYHYIDIRLIEAINDQFAELVAKLAFEKFTGAKSPYYAPWYTGRADVIPNLEIMFTSPERIAEHTELNSELHATAFMIVGQLRGHKSEHETLLKILELDLDNLHDMFKSLNNSTKS